MPPSTRDYWAMWGIINLKDTSKNNRQRGENTQILCLRPSEGGSTFTRQWVQLRWTRLGLGPSRGTAGSQVVRMLHLGTDSSGVHRKCKIKMQHSTEGTAEHFHHQKTLEKTGRGLHVSSAATTGKDRISVPVNMNQLIFFCFNKAWTPQHSTVSPYLQVHRRLI